MVDVILFVVSWSQNVLINFMSLLLHHICQLGKRIQEQQQTGDSSTHYTPVLVSCMRDDAVIGRHDCILEEKLEKEIICHMV